MLFPPPPNKSADRLVYAATPMTSILFFSWSRAAQLQGGIVALSADASRARSRRAWLLAAITLLPVWLMAADGSRDEVSPPFGPGRVGARATRAAEGRTPMSDASNAFAFNLYAKLAEDKELAGQNLFYSPYSITTALAMVAEGARRETAEQMGAVLKYPAGWRRAGGDAKARPWNEAPVYEGVAALARRFAQQAVSAGLQSELDTARKAHGEELAVAEKIRQGRNPDWAAYREQMEKVKKAGANFDAVVAKVPGYELSTANALWAEKTFPFEPEYITSVTGHYAASISAVDFINNFDGVRLQINDWIALKTKDKVKDMLKPGSLTTMTRLVLANAIFFHGTWQVPFEPEHTRSEDFFEPNAKASVPMMSQQSMEHVTYAAYNADGTLFATPDMANGATKAADCYPDDQGFLVAELPYKGDGIVMTILAPRAPRGLSALEGKLTANNVREWTSRLAERKTNVALPKFKFKTTYNLNEKLKALGMPRAFDSGSAQFEGMSPMRLYIGWVQHDAYIDVNEKGTEAAAATVIAMMGSGAPASEWPFIPTFRADRPFLFLIRDRVSGTILFVGRVMKPEV